MSSWRRKWRRKEAGCINCRCDGRRNATSPKKSTMARVRMVTIGGGKMEKEENGGEQGDAALCGTWLGAVDDDGARFIVPLGILHPSLLAAKLAVYVTPASDWHASAGACMLLSIIPDSARHCYRVIFWKFARGFYLEMKFVRWIYDDILKEWIIDDSSFTFQFFLTIA